MAREGAFCPFLCVVYQGSASVRKSLAMTTSATATMSISSKGNGQRRGSTTDGGTGDGAEPGAEAAVTHAAGGVDESRRIRRTTFAGTLTCTGSDESWSYNPCEVKTHGCVPLYIDAELETALTGGVEGRREGGGIGSCRAWVRW